MTIFLGILQDVMEKNPFKAYQDEIEKTVSGVQARLTNEKQRVHVPYSEYIHARIVEEVRSVLGRAFDLSEAHTRAIVIVPPPGAIDADLAVALFPITAVTKKNPVELAKFGAKALCDARTTFIESASPAGPYVNIVLNKETVYTHVLAQIASLDTRYGESDVHRGKVVVMDYSAPNIAKPMGVGHLRSTIIGQALLNIYRATGYSTVGDNHLGDWGTQFGKLLYAYRTWGDEKAMEREPITYLKDLYVRFGREAEKAPEIVDEARELFSRLERKDAELVALWRKFRDLSLLEFERVYERLGIRFDLEIGESYFIDATDPLVDDCLEKGICKIDKETSTVFVDAIADMPSFLLRKKDGSSLYMTRDVATIRFRKERFSPDDIVYVVGSEQELNFKQLFALVDTMGYKGDTRFTHVGFGMVLVDGKKMSTRKGTIVELNKLLDESVDRARKTVLEKNGGTDIPAGEVAMIAEKIGTSVIVYNDLRQSRKKNISFDWEKMLDPKGESAVYLQYTAVRIRSILKKLSYEGAMPEQTRFEVPSEFALARKLMFFPERILEAKEGDAPHVICTYLEELAQTFNSFYNDVSIIRTEDADLRLSRALLIKSVADTLEKGLSILNISVPERM